MFSYVHSRQTCLLKTVSSLMYFSEDTVLYRCRKPSKRLLVIVGSIHEFGLMCDCALSMYFELVFFVSSIIGDVNV